MLLRVALLLALATLYVFGYPDDYHNQQMVMNGNTNRSALFCFINGTRIEMMSRRNTGYYYFNKDHLSVNMCTHIVYAAAYMEPNSWAIKPISQDLTEQTGNKITFTEITDAAHRKNIKVIISISASLRDFSNMARSTHRDTFIKNARDFMSNHKFDGINIDWRYPSNKEGGGLPDDKEKYAALLKELENFTRGDAKLLTASLSPIRRAIVEGFDYVDNVMMEAVDYWLLMSTEYYGHWSSYGIGANAPIKSREQLSVKKTIDDVKDLFGKHSYKVILAVPFYGKKFQLKEALRNNESPIGKTFVSYSAAVDSVFYTYRDVCMKIAHEDPQNWRRGFDHFAMVPYAVKDLSVYVYEDAESVREKTKLALRSGLGGVMAYSLDMDDFVGDCGNNNRPYTNDNYNYNSNSNTNEHGKFPLLRSMYETIQQNPNSAGLRSASLGLVLAAVISVFFKIYV